MSRREHPGKGAEPTEVPKSITEGMERPKQAIWHLDNWIYIPLYDTKAGVGTVRRWYVVHGALDTSLPVGHMGMRRSGNINASGKQEGESRKQKPCIVGLKNETLTLDLNMRTYAVYGVLRMESSIRKPEQDRCGDYEMDQWIVFICFVTPYQ